ncbi:MAG: hypothetical protein ACYCSN_21105, partial [Acidobacteriaceae bacterium]
AASDQEIRQLQDRARLYEAYSTDEFDLWLKFVQPKAPASGDFAALSKATKLVLRSAGSDEDFSSPYRVNLAARCLSSTMLLGEAVVPSDNAIDYVLEFVVADGRKMVVLSKNAAYYRGNVYFRPGLATWLRTSLHGDSGSGG